MNLDTYNPSINNLYSNYHKVDIYMENGSTVSRNVLINIIKTQHYLEIKLRDQNDFAFNFTTAIDWTGFDKMKHEQHLEISFEEFHLQLIDLLKQTVAKGMLLRLEQGKTSCRMIFFEKSKIKSLIFLILDLLLTDQKDIIKEMIINIEQLKECNNNVNMQLHMVTSQLKEKDTLLNAALAAQLQSEKQFVQDLKLVGNAFHENICKVEKRIVDRLNNLNKRYIKLLKDINFVKNENKYRENICSQTLFQLEQFKRDNEKNYKVIDSLEAQIENLNQQKSQHEKITSELRQSITKKDQDIEALGKQIVELKRDIQDATIIVAQKTKTHNELAKDLVQANTMLVNFNKQYDVISKEADHLRIVVKNKEQELAEQSFHLKRLKEDFDNYKKECDMEEMHSLRRELLHCRERIEELEKNNREAVKINGLLTKKLATGDMTVNSRPTHWMQSK